jgi:hypothetical protein
VLVLRIVPVTIALMGVPVGYVFYQAAVSVITGSTKGTVLAIGTMVAVAAHLIQSRCRTFHHRNWVWTPQSPTNTNLSGNRPRVTISGTRYKWTKPTIQAREICQFGPRATKDLKSVLGLTEILMQRGMLIPIPTPNRQNIRQWYIVREPTKQPTTGRSDGQSLRTRPPAL